MRKLLIGIVVAVSFAAGTFATATPLVITPSAPVVTAGGKQQFSVTSSGGGVPVVFWTVSGSNCSGFACGNVSIIGGLYTAPATVSTTLNVTITATSIRDSTSTGSTTITVSPISSGGGGISVSINPSLNVQVTTGSSMPFSATVSGTSNQAVTWSVGGNCGANCGTITQAGLYTAPGALPGTLSATITATSQASASASSSVTIQIVPAVVISMNSFNAQMNAGSQQQFSATVTGSTNHNVRWGVSGTGCSGTSCGTITSTGRYTAPASVSTFLNVVVQATAQADMSKNATAAVTVGTPVTVAVATSGLSLSTNASQEYTATVTGAANPGLTWSVSGPGCSGLTCGQVTSIGSNTALYQAPASILSPATVTITAAFVSDATKNGSATATIVGLSNNRLSGPYAFLFKGFDATGPYQAAGVVTADGNGHLNSGVEDITCGFGSQDPICAGGPVLNQAFTGTYTVNADGRGTFAITPTGGTTTYTFTLAVNTVNTKARFIESDGSGIRGSGVMELQNTSAFANSAFTSGFAFSLSGLDASGLPIAEIGNMELFINFSSVPAISAGMLDVNDNGVLSCFPPETVNTTSCPSAGTPFNRFSGLYNIGPNGRGTATFLIQGFDGSSADTNTLNFNIYVVSSGEFFLLSTDDPGSTKNPVVSGQALQQMTTPSSAFQSGSSVLSWSGWSAVPGGSAAGTLGVPQAAVGQVSMDGMGNFTNVYYDLNNGGTTAYANFKGACSTVNKKGQTVANTFCNYALQQNGDILLTVFNRPTNTTSVFRVFPISVNTGFLLGIGASSVVAGKIESQVPTAFPFPFMFGSDLMVAPNALLQSGTGSLAQPKALDSPVMGNQDESSTSGFVPNLLFSGKYGPTGLPNGQAFMYLDSTDLPTLDFWVVSAYKTVALDVDSGAVPNLVIFEY